MVAAVSEAEIHAAARALDRMALEAQGWSRGEIEDAIREGVPPSPISLSQAKAALAAAVWARAMGIQ